jgi:hypothetical protein
VDKVGEILKVTKSCVRHTTFTGWSNVRHCIPNVRHCIPNANADVGTTNTGLIRTGYTRRSICTTAVCWHKPLRVVRMTFAICRQSCGGCEQPPPCEATCELVSPSVPSTQQPLTRRGNRQMKAATCSKLTFLIRIARGHSNNTLSPRK